MNLELVEQIVSVLGEYPVSEILVEQEGRRVNVRRPLGAGLALPHRASEAAAESVAEAPNLAAPEPLRTLSATMVGIFHHADPPVAYAALMAPGQRVGFIESMKLMNDVVVEEGGRISEILVEDGAPVEYGQPLFRLAPE